MADSIEAIDNKIIDKLRKIKALADRGGTPDECATATAILQEMMLRYGIEQEQLRPKTQSRYAGYGRKFYRNARYNNYGAQLMTVIAKGFNVRVVCHDHNQTTATYALMGEENLVRACEKVHREVVEILLSMAKLRYAEYKLECMRELGRPISRHLFVNSYMSGACDAIRIKMRDASASVGTALMVISEKTDEVTQKLYPALVRGRSRHVRISGDARGRGFADGSNMNVRNAVGVVRRERIS